jgi:hypothetical protein
MPVGQNIQALARSGGVAEGWIYGEAPLLQQPFRDVDSIPVFFAPGAEFTRGGIHLRRELQVSHPKFEFSRKRGSVWNGAPPIGVAAFARVDDRYRHRPRSYATIGDPPENVCTEARGLRNLEAQ